MEREKGRRLPKEEKRNSNNQTSTDRRSKPWALIAAKVLVIPFLLFISLMIGLMIGYSVVGDLPVSEVFQIKTYKHMYDLIFSGT